MRPQQIGQKRSSIMGRPLGARDKFPRGTGTAERIKIIETENGQLLREIADLKQQIENPHPAFEGDSVALLEATQHGHYCPSWMQFRAAVALYERDWDMRRVAMDAERASLEQQRIEYHNGDATLDRLIADFRQFTADRDDELTQLLESGDVTPAGAQAIRSWFIKEERLALPPPATLPAAPAAIQSDGAPAPSAPSASASVPSTLPWADVVEPLPRVLFADKPFIYFQTASGRRFESNSACEVEPDAVDPDDVADLLRAGCRERK